jgi:imidazolonepropionase-like amidohydrolase
MGFVTSPLPEVADAGQAAATARALLAQGVDGLKLFASSPHGDALPEGALAAAVGEARRAGRPVFVHPNTADDLLAALNGGADVVAHTTPGTGPWDAALLGTMRESGVALVPTLSLWRQMSRHDRRSTQERLTATAVAQLRAWVEADGPVLFGTDYGAVAADPTEEYRLMAEAGMSFRQILASLTTAPGERFDASGRQGRIGPGYRADLVVLARDPAEDLDALSHVRCTIRAGAVVYRAK